MLHQSYFSLYTFAVSLCERLGQDIKILTYKQMYTRTRTHVRHTHHKVLQRTTHTTTHHTIQYTTQDTRHNTTQDTRHDTRDYTQYEIPYNPAYNKQHSTQYYNADKQSNVLNN